MHKALYSDRFGKHGSVEPGLPLDRSRIGPRRGGHAVEPHGAARVAELHASADGRFAAARDGPQRIGGLLARRNDRTAGGNAGEQSREVDLAHHLKKIVGGIVFQSDDFDGRVVERNSFGGAESCDPIPVEPTARRVEEAGLVSEKTHPTIRHMSF